MLFPSAYYCNAKLDTRLPQTARPILDPNWRPIRERASICLEFSTYQTLSCIYASTMDSLSLLNDGLK